MCLAPMTVSFSSLRRAPFGLHRCSSLFSYNLDNFSRALFRLVNFSEMAPTRPKSNVPLVGVIQMCASNDTQCNWVVCKKLILDAAIQDAKMVFLPECFDFIAETKEEMLSLASTLDGPMITRYRELAKSCNVWLSLGGFHERKVISLNGTSRVDGTAESTDKSQSISNSHVIISAEGEIKAVYRKIHLFDVDLPDEGISLKESSYVSPGQDIVAPVATPVGHIGLGICYDMRFPDFSTSLSLSGNGHSASDILTYPSTFTVVTGPAHWETLLRARAIENQVFVIAAAQSGTHNRKRKSYGHAIVIDPWGKILAEAKPSAGDNQLLLASINLDDIKIRRSEMPVREHRRNDLYGKPLGPSLPVEWSIPRDDELFPWGNDIILKGNIVFCRSSYSIAFVNRKCVLPGHVLVSPIRSVRRLFELRPEETADMFMLIQKVQRVLERVHGTSSSTIAIQDGPDAGQTIMHLHVHIIPRKATDFGGHSDAVYEQLSKHDKGSAVQWREESEMIEECQALRKYFAGGSCF